MLPDGISIDWGEFGRNYFKSVERQLHEFVCGVGGESEDYRHRLLDAFNIGKDAIVGILAAAIASWLGVAPAIAAIIAAIVIKIFFRPLYEEFCQAWGQGLEQTAAPATA